MDEETTRVVGAPRLLDQVRDAIRRRHYSIRTEQSYVHWIKRFIFFSGKRHPRELGAPEVTAFLSHLARDRDVAEIPRLLGHASVETTMIYTHVMNKGGRGVASPLDALPASG